MFIELEEIVSSGITAGKKRPVVVNVDKISSFTPLDKGTQISLRRATLHVSEGYDDIISKLVLVKQVIAKEGNVE